MIEILRELFSYNFIVRALLVGTLVSLCAALLGVNLVLKRYSMIGDGLSHVGFGSLAAAMALGLAPLAVSIPVVVLAAFLLLRLSESSRIKGDAAIAILKRMDSHEPQMRQTCLDDRVIVLVHIEPVHEIHHLSIQQMGWRCFVMNLLAMDRA